MMHPVMIADSIFWNEYEETAYQVIRNVVENVNETVKRLIWFHIELNYMLRDYEEYDEESLIGELFDYILCSVAADYKSPKIEKYLSTPLDYFPE